MTTAGEMPGGGSYIGSGLGYEEAVRAAPKVDAAIARHGAAVLTAYRFAASGELGDPGEATAEIDGYARTQGLPVPFSSEVAELRQGVIGQE